MKRLVVCCDGTWGSAVNRHVTNVEKIARAVRTDAPVDGVQQMVYSIGGVGARGYLADRVLGGAWGYGFTANVIDCYRFLAMNYDPGDEIFVIGFSRGAYTARSVAGMVASVGLLRGDEVVHDGLAGAEQAYRDYTPDGRARRAAFKAAHCYRETAITFLGVFDTVGALGVPAPFLKRARFHDVSLSASVRCARQALSIDDRRIKFEPCLWSVAPDDPPGRVKQVWFPGSHSEVGGGGAHRGLADVALRWMLGEARAAGLVVDEQRVAAQVDDDAPYVSTPGPGPLFTVVNAVDSLRRHPRFRRSGGPGGGWRRRLGGVPAPDPTQVYVASIAAHADRMSRVDGSVYAREAVNIGWWRDAADGALPVEPLPFLDGDTRTLTFR
ncbi:DUF2235 domain-containing protein [Luteimicrobium subarcticum]|uniref:Uncharacterized protein (DUF2235 family) n=1 Tax=Luteimicrobium subarcticum TaxID=620910 RepID=A0A2M8WUX3_9MICO|nr:DUF2235 domain-containing protein [Luteimicrobium subarcticum]PJI94730.1 uncharacterized protein (DUF2235 family) [Luteimicrobium subarcticum]